jgi:peroxiredoxin
MGGILFKTIAGQEEPSRTVQNLQCELNRWCEAEAVKPVTCWSGYLTDSARPPSGATVREQITAGVTAIRLPVGSRLTP